MRQRRTVARPLVPDPCCSPLSVGVVLILLPGGLRLVSTFRILLISPCRTVVMAARPMSNIPYDCDPPVMVVQTVLAGVKSRGVAHPLATGRVLAYSFSHGDVAYTCCRPLSGCALPLGSQALNG
jgi:hypothetical protein